jgi:hypothetical protein
MQQHDEEIAALVMEHLGQLPAADRSPLLRLIAQDARQRTAREALRRLEALATAGDVEALRALSSLQWTLPPALAGEVTRMVHKLHLRGVSASIPPSEGWRALLAPAEASGEMWLWLLTEPEADAQEVQLATLLIQPRGGILSAHFVERVDRSRVPEQQRIRHTVAVPLSPSEETIILEIPFELGRALVQMALRAHWRGDAPIPLAGEYRLYNEWIWQFGKPTLDPGLQALVDEPWPAGPLSQRNAEKAADALLAHACMSSWIIPSVQVNFALFAGEPGVVAKEPTEMARRFLTFLAGTREAGELLHSLTDALRMQSIWLHIAGESDLSRYARTLSAHMFDWRLDENPLVFRMTVKGMTRLLERGKRRQEP